MDNSNRSNQQLVERYTKTSKATVFYYTIIFNLLMGTIIIIVLMITSYLHKATDYKATEAPIHNFVRKTKVSLNTCSPAESLKSSQSPVVIPRNPSDKQNVYETTIAEVSLCKLEDESKEHQAQEGNELVLVKLVFKNTSDSQQYTPSDYDFLLQNEEVTVRPREYVVLDPPMPSYYDSSGNPKYELAPNESATHTMVFEVSKSSNNGKLLFGSQVDLETIIEIGELTWM